MHHNLSRSSLMLIIIMIGVIFSASLMTSGLAQATARSGQRPTAVIGEPTERPTATPTATPSTPRPNTPGIIPDWTKANVISSYCTPGRNRSDCATVEYADAANTLYEKPSLRREATLCAGAHCTPNPPNDARVAVPRPECRDLDDKLLGYPPGTWHYGARFNWWYVWNGRTLQWEFQYTGPLPGTEHRAFAASGSCEDVLRSLPTATPTATPTAIPTATPTLRPGDPTPPPPPPTVPPPPTEIPTATPIPTPTAGPCIDFSPAKDLLGMADLALWVEPSNGTATQHLTTWNTKLDAAHRWDTSELVEQVNEAAIQSTSPGTAYLRVNPGAITFTVQASQRASMTNIHATQQTDWHRGFILVVKDLGDDKVVSADDRTVAWLELHGGFEIAVRDDINPPVFFWAMATIIRSDVRNILAVDTPWYNVSNDSIGRYFPAILQHGATVSSRGVFGTAKTYREAGGVYWDTKAPYGYEGPSWNPTTPLGSMTFPAGRNSWKEPDTLRGERYADFYAPWPTRSFPQGDPSFRKMPWDKWLLAKPNPMVISWPAMPGRTYGVVLFAAEGQCGLGGHTRYHIVAQRFGIAAANGAITLNAPQGVTRGSSISYRVIVENPQPEGLTTLVEPVRNAAVQLSVPDTIRTLIRNNPALLQEVAIGRRPRNGSLTITAPAGFDQLVRDAILTPGRSIPIGDLAAGETVTIFFAIQTTQETPPVVDVTATLTAENDGDGRDNTARASTTVSGESRDVEIRISAPRLVREGQTYRVTITARHLPPPPNVTSGPVSGTVEYRNGTNQQTFSFTNLAPGQSQTFTVDVTAPQQRDGALSAMMRHRAALVAATPPDQNATNNVAAVVTSVLVNATEPEAVLHVAGEQASVQEVTSLPLNTTSAPSLVWLVGQRLFVALQPILDPPPVIEPPLYLVQRELVGWSVVKVDAVDRDNNLVSIPWICPRNNAREGLPCAYPLVEQAPSFRNMRFNMGIVWQVRPDPAVVAGSIALPYSYANAPDGNREFRLTIRYIVRERIVENGIDLDGDGRIDTVLAEYTNPRDHEVVMLIGATQQTQ